MRSNRALGMAGRESKEAARCHARGPPYSLHRRKRLHAGVQRGAKCASERAKNTVLKCSTQCQPPIKAAWREVRASGSLMPLVPTLHSLGVYRNAPSRAAQPSNAPKTSLRRGTSAPVHRPVRLRAAHPQQNNNSRARCYPRRSGRLPNGRGEIDGRSRRLTGRLPAAPHRASRPPPSDWAERRARPHERHTHAAPCPG